MNGPTHQYAAASTLAHVEALNRFNVKLALKQQPLQAKQAMGKEKDRKPIDPPPVVQMEVSPRADPMRQFLYSPHFFVTCILLADEEKNKPSGTLGTALTGTLVSSLHKLKEGNDNTKSNPEGAYFVFADLSVKVEGSYRLQFNLYEMNSRVGNCTYIHSIVSEPFEVHAAKAWPGMMESTRLTRAFSDQGVRLRIRKEPRSLLKKRGPASEDYEPRRYRKSQSNQQTDKGSVGESDTRRDSQQSPSDRRDSIDQLYTQVRALPQRVYSPEPQDYSDSNQYENPPAKRARTSSTHSSIPSFGQETSIANPQMDIQNIYTESQQSSLNYGQSANQQSQGGFYENSNFMSSLQSMTVAQEPYFNRTQLNPRSSSAYDSNAQRSPMMLQSQNTSRFSQLQFGMSAQNQNLTFQPRNELVEEGLDLFGLQSRPQTTMGTTGLMAPPPIGRINTTGFGGLGIQNTSRTLFQSGVGHNQNLSAGSIGGSLFSSSRAPASMGILGPPSLESEGPYS